jgi:hypothetical protein
MRRQFLPPAPPLAKMRCIRELAGTEGQVHAGAADSCGVVVVHGRDSAVGEVLCAEATDPMAACEPAGPNGSCDAGPGDAFRDKHAAGDRSQNYVAATAPSTVLSGDSQKRTVVIENDLPRGDFDRGAVVKLATQAFQDDAKHRGARRRAS